ncbi:restriction endonuclease subunit S [Limosilactobacillus reuteri]|uniref:restriction endonuclease subunit S n=1 Tax=Limosilactobacillus reuteri TaxID=1598 RepID=UPI000B982653|nr:restriction endonuclease subunit S [Limosilactobacillus reuteri]OYS99624.1 hypothetical protein CBG22_07150 [Limosilactobacillus reuteri]
MTKEQNKKAPNLRFKGFTNDWEQRKLGEVIELEDNKRKPVKASKRIPGNIPYYGANGIQDYVKGYTHTGEHVLVAEDGANSISNYPVYFICSPSWINNHSHVLTGKGSIISNKFLTYNLKTVPYANYLVGSGRYKLNAETLKIIPIKLPLLTEQNYIGSTLSKIDKLITLQQRKLELLKEIKKGLLQKMFADKSKFPILRFEGFHDEWEQCKLGELYSYHNGKAHEQNQRSSGKYELINLNSISVDGTLKSSGRYINHADEILRQNDLVMILSDIAHGTLLGRVAIIPQDNKYVLNQRVALLRPISKSENSNFMAPLINNNQRYFHKMGIGTSQLNISKSTVIESLWQIPKIKEQSVIGNFLQNIDHIIALQHQRLSKLDEIKKSLLQQMFI